MTPFSLGDHQRENEKNMDILAEHCMFAHEIAFDLLKQLNGKKLAGRGRFFAGILRRQAMILHDINNLMKRNPPDQMISIFALFRCLIDDFIVVTYLKLKNYADEEIHCHIGASVGKEFKMYKQSWTINDKYFEGKRKGLATKEFYEKKKNEFLSDPENDKFFSDKKAFEFKVFPATTHIVSQHFEADDFGASNAHSLVMWQLLSKYVHYSEMMNRLEAGTPETRGIEIVQLQEALLYCVKTISLSVKAFAEDKVELKINDRMGLINHLTKEWPE